MLCAHGEPPVSALHWCSFAPPWGGTLFACNGSGAAHPCKPRAMLHGGSGTGLAQNAEPRAAREFSGGTGIACTKTKPDVGRTGYPPPTYSGIPGSGTAGLRLRTILVQPEAVYRLAR